MTALKHQRNTGYWAAKSIVRFFMHLPSTVSGERHYIGRSSI